MAKHDGGDERRSSPSMRAVASRPVAEFGFDPSITRNALAGLDVGALAQNVRASLDAAAVMRNALAGLDTSTLAQNALASLDSSAATRSFLTNLATVVEAPDDVDLDTEQFVADIETFVAEQADALEEALVEQDLGPELETHDLAAILTPRTQAVILATVWVTTFVSMVTVVLHNYEVSDAVGTVTGASSMWVADRVRQVVDLLIKKLLEDSNT